MEEINKLCYHDIVYGNKRSGEDRMRISTKGRYALRLMLDVAANDSEGYVSLRDAAAR